MPFDKSDKTNVPGVGVLSDSTRSNARAIVWDTAFTYQGQVTTTTTRRPLYRSQRYVCPQGMFPIRGTGEGTLPNVCSSDGLWSINIEGFRQIHSCPASDRPCHPSSTDKSRVESDFTFAGRVFQRSYHSLREDIPTTFRMGIGWTHTFGSRLFPPGTGGAGLVLGGSRMQIQYISALARYVVPKLNDAPLVQLANSTWQLQAQNGDVSVFSQDGRLLSIRNAGRPNEDVTLEYEASGQLSRVIDGKGAALQFGYDWYGLLTSATLPDGTTYSYIYDAHENLVQVQASSGGTKQYHYGEAGLATNGDPGLLTGITYEDGRRYASFGYDIHGRVVLSALLDDTGAASETTRIHYNGANSAQVTTTDGAVRTYTYSTDPQRMPLSISDGSGVTTYTYDSYGRKLTMTDGRGVQSRYTYTSGKQTAFISAHATAVQRTEQTDWHATLNVPIERRTLDASNFLVSKTTWTYNPRGQVLTGARIDPATGAARATTYTWCEKAGVDSGDCPRVGLLLSVDGPRTDVADITMYTYYSDDHPSCAVAPIACPHHKGDLWKITDALGHTTETLAYDSAGRPLQVKDANGVVTEMTYHSRGGPMSRSVKGLTPAEDRITLIDYWPTGLIRRVTQSDGSHTEYIYDAGQRLIEIEDGEGNSLHYILDNAGNRTGEQTRDSGGNLTRTLSRVYDQLGQLQSQSDAYQNATAYAYDPNGNVTGVGDALGRGTASSYDPLNRLKQTIQDMAGVAATTQFQYDALDNLTKVIDPKGLSTDYTYNGLGDLTQLSSPDTGLTGYTYDSAGNRKTQTDARGVTATYGYDAANRLTSISYPTATLNVAYQYDTANAVCPSDEAYALGRLTAIEDASGITQYCYTRFGELARKVQTTNGMTFTLRYSYDAAGRLSGMVYPDGAAIDYVRDGEGHVTAVGVTSPGMARRLVLSGAGQAPFGPSTGWIYGNGRSFTRTLNQNYQPQAIHDANPGGLSLGFGFDAVGNLTTLRDATQTTQLAQYAYDGLNRLQQTKDGPTGTPIETYAYDATGNRQSVVNAGGTTAYSYAMGSHRLDAVDGVARSYDAAGNMTGLSTGLGFAYSDAGRMELVSQGPTVALQYAYNGKGEQVRRAQRGDSTYYLYDEAGHLLGEYDDVGAPKQQVIWFGDLPVGLLMGGGTNQALHYIEPDHLGTPRVVIDGVRDVAIWKWDLKGEAFGATPPNQNPDGDADTFVFNLRFPGQRYDSATGLNYNYFRDYDPSTGRYVESDPIGLKGGLSTYAYVNSSPLVAADPSGLVKWKGQYSFIGAAENLGYMHQIYDLESECIEGKKAWVRVVADFGGAAFGSLPWKRMPFSSRVAVGGGPAEFDDGLVFLMPSYVFNGEASQYSLSSVLVAGFSAGKTVLGQARSTSNIFSVSPEFGVDVGFSYMRGKSTLISSRSQDCGCAK